MTDLDVVLQKLTTIEETQKIQGADIKELSKGFSILAAQSEQITNLQTQTATLWRKYDSLTGAESIIEKVRDHQKQCPREEMHRTFKWVWGAIGTHTLIFILLIGALLKSAG